MEGLVTRPPTAGGSDKPERYRGLRASVHALVEGERDWLANLANVAAEVYRSVPGLTWSGFYLMRGPELVLGPFQGRPACVRIAIGRGVCGTAVAQRRSLLVPDVHEFPGHIACDERSRSELVVPILVGDAVVAVLDLDSDRLAHFDDDDRTGLEAIAEDLGRTVDWANALRV